MYYWFCEWSGNQVDSIQFCLARLYVSVSGRCEVLDVEIETDAAQQQTK